MCVKSILFLYLSGQFAETSFGWGAWVEVWDAEAPTLISHFLLVFVWLCVSDAQFGQPDKAMPSHGVARTATWKLSEEEVPAVEGHVKVKEKECFRFSSSARP